MTIPAPTVTGYSGMFNLTGDRAGYSMLTATQGGNRGRTEKWISKLLSRRQQMQPLRLLMKTLNGAAAGSSASVTLQRVDAQATDPSNQTGIAALGGNRVTSAVSLINRVTTAADVTYINQILDQRFGLAIASYPVVSGSGGGGKLGAF